MWGWFPAQARRAEAAAGGEMDLGWERLVVDRGSEAFGRGQVVKVRVQALTMQAVP
jgi:hypothetical protein